MASDLRIRIAAEDNASAVFERVGDSAQTMGQAIEQAGASGAGIQSLTAQIKAMESELRTVGTTFAAMGAAGVTGLGFATNASMQFTSALANVNSIARLSASELASLETAILGMAAQFSAMPTDLAEGLYDIVGSGFEATDALLILEAATVSAGAGLTSTATAATAITAVLNAYGKSADEAGDVSDILFKTVDSGVITFEELAGSLGRVLPVASSLDIAIEELGAAYAELTVQGINASEAETAIAAVLTAALNPTEAMTDAVREYGYASAEALIQAEGLTGYLEFLAEASGGTSEGMMDLVGNVRALQGALALTRNDGEGFAAMLTDMETAAQDGAYTLEVFGIQMDNAAGAVRNAQSEIAVAAIAIGSAFEPLVGMGATAVANVVGHFNQLPGAGQQAIVTFTGVASAAALLQGGLMLAIPKIVEFRNAMATLRASGSILGTLAGRIGPITLGIGALAAGGILLYNAFNQAGESTRKLDAELGSLADTIERLKLSGDTALAAEAQILLTEIETFAGILRDGRTEILQAAFDLPEGITQTDLFSKPIGDDLQRAMDMADDFVAHVSTTLTTLTAEQQMIYLQHVNAMLDSAETTMEGSNLPDIMNDIMITPASEIPGVMAAATDAMDAFTASLRNLLAGGITGGLTSLERDMSALNDSIPDAGETIFGAAEDVVAAAAAMAELRDTFKEGLLDFANVDLAKQINLAGLGTDATGAAQSINEMGAALDSVLSTYSQIDAMGQRYGQAVSIAETLIGEPGVWGEIDNMLQRGTISLEQYNAAVEAGHAIQLRQAEVEENLNIIRANQIPLLGEVADAYADQIAQITAMTDAQEQMAALGWMDTGMQERVQQFTEMVSLMGRMGSEGAAGIQQMIDGIAATDPVLTAMLENLGLIEAKANGKYELTVDAQGAVSEIQMLTNTLGDLIDVLDDGLLNQSYTIDVDADVSQADATVRDWATQGYTGGYYPTIPVDADTAPAEATLLDIPVTFWEVPVDANTGPAAASLNAFEPPVINVPVEFTAALGGVLANAAGASLTAANAAAALGIPESVTVTVSQTGAEETVAALNDVTAAALAIPEIEIVTVTAPGAASSASLLDDVTASANAIPEAETVAVSVIGASNAVAALNNVAAAANAIPASVSTTITTNLVTNRITNYSTTGVDLNPYSGGRVPPGGRHGGVFGYQHGGVVIEMAEAFPEMLHLAGGGMVPIHDRGYYEVPRGSYVSPTLDRTVARGSIHLGGVHIYGNVYGIDDLTERVATEVAPALAEAWQRNEREQGVVW